MSNYPEYFIPSGSGSSEYEEKRSHFIAYLEPAENEEYAKAYIAEIKKKNYDARHNCWCYIIKNGPERYSDDGEPQGTAGIPMLEVFRHENITNVVCVVTRYFGGVLLGTGGLARAYAKAAKGALEDAGISVVRRWIECRIDCPYPLFDRLRSEIDLSGGCVSSIEYGRDISVILFIPEEAYPSFKKSILELSSGRLEPLFLNNNYRALHIK